ncbi:MAG: DUF452 family protein [Marinilabiliaceae bacterium]|nr:DUF452 family protein [Marinilabiliaceae bacterium]
MQHFWLKKQNCDHLIIFFGGWGTDKNPFSQLECNNFDLLMFYDYKLMELPIGFELIISSYPKITLIAWSLGVWVANELIAPFIDNISYGLAINGTLDPISDDKGLPIAVFDGTLQNMSALNLVKFNRRMVLRDKDRKLFEANIPHRKWEDLRDELAHLKEVIKPSSNEVYSHAFIGTSDLVFLTENQKNYWSDSVIVIEKETAHFPFYHFSSWDDILKLIIE